MKSTYLTIAPIEASQPGRPEFADAQGVKAQFGLKHALLWRLAAQRKIRTVSIREPGKARGKTLFDCDSIRAFLLENVGPSDWNPKAIAQAKRASAEEVPA